MRLGGVQQPNRLVMAPSGHDLVKGLLEAAGLFLSSCTCLLGQVVVFDWMPVLTAASAGCNRREARGKGAAAAAEAEAKQSQPSHLSKDATLVAKSQAQFNKPVCFGGWYPCWCCVCSVYALLAIFRLCMLTMSFSYASLVKTIEGQLWHSVLQSFCFASKIR